MNQLLFIFLDGVGLGSDNPEVNPFVAASTPFWHELLGAALTASLANRLEPRLVFKQLDATLGHTGLPQSATGQTALLTGKNGADIMQRHYGPWPGPTLKKELDEGTLFSEVIAAGYGASLANVYPPGFFKALASGKQRHNVPVYAAAAAGIRLRTLDDYLTQAAISVDLTGEHLQRYSQTIHTLTPFQSGQRLVMLAREAQFTFFDYWLSDSVGHRGTFAEAVSLIERLDAFLAGVLSSLEDVTCLLSSDHGNLEDKTVRSHTRAPVPLMVAGAGANLFKEANSILDIAPLIRKLLKLT